ncbi:probable phospholipid-transporting ATPase IA isoform X2 [Hydractinia symbiolongicarpus]|uniref:probable phospholipid-transporting ATPase IA isoform X2 n=1 Tax=Hydractinia symbiolongicarpus TaxID=13093 RepID=UPI00254D78F5|nr:probable phospholipid-transporting ATPase IA isoform X2 [Hydractinia symbiolongicarpus]
MDYMKFVLSGSGKDSRPTYLEFKSYGTLKNEDEEDGSKTADRIIIINGHQLHKYSSNKISTAKYNFLTFLPKFLLEQFSRYANVFFLLIALLQQIPNVSPTGRYTTAVPLLFVLSCSAIKEIIEDVKRHRGDDQTNNRRIQVIREHQLQTVKWTEVVVGDIVKVENGHFFPADLILLSSSEPMGMCYIETANLDGETNLKIRQALPLTAEKTTVEEISDMSGKLECEGPNNRLYDFIGNIILDGNSAVPLSGDQVLLRGAQLRNTKWIFGFVVYTGHESKLLQNATAAPIKRSNVDRMTNIQILFLFGLLLLLALLSAIGNTVWTNKHKSAWYLGFGDMKAQNFGFTFLTFFILYNNLIPISLPVTLEVVKFLQAQFINWDLDMYYESSDTPAMARTSNLNEELGQVKFIFSDKTGTLTRNIMELRRMTVAGVNYGGEGDKFNDPKFVKDLHNSDHAHHIREFLTLMSVCHTVVPERDNDDHAKIIYQGASPDEEALVKGAASFGYVFNTRTPTSVVVDMDGSESVFEILNVLEFDSTRKRMSVIVKTPDQRIKLLCKGADTVIYERLAEEQEFADITLKHLEDFAKDGLRTLCIAVAEISNSDYEAWNKTYYEASIALDDRDKKLNEASELIERNLTLVGATAIEDKLQEGVPESIANLSSANIKIWVLTGDKQETAINIGYSCRLLRDELNLLICEGKSPTEVRGWINDQLIKYDIQKFKAVKKKQKRVVKETKDLALIVTGSVLHHALHDECKDWFLDLALVCRAVIACRVSPLQKSQLVQLVKQNVQGAITLAIGDGANDVSMIQAAHVGVGISGQEGLQAATASDYAIAQFRYLNKLLFVHGAFSYQRLSKLILYSFYKNICLYVIELWFAFSNGFSGQILFDKWCIGLYNVIFTMLPPLAFGLFDRTCSSEARMTCPRLYKNSQQSHLFNVKVFWIWIFTAIYHSILLFYLPRLIFEHDVAFSDGLVVGQWFVGDVVYTCVVITVCLKAALEIDTWSIYSHISIWGSIISWFIFLLIYCTPLLAMALAPNMIGQDRMLYTCVLFWLTALIIPVITLFVDFLFHSFQRTFKKNTRQKIQELELKGIQPSDWVIGDDGVPQRRHSTFEEIPKMNASFRGDRGFAFSQEEHGQISQAEMIRMYDTTLEKPRGN